MSYEYLNFEQITTSISFEDIATSFDKQKTENNKNDNPQISIDEQKHEIAVMARLISKGHVAYPLWDSAITEKFKEKVVDLYNNINLATDVKSFYSQIDGLLQKLPDEHLRVATGNGNLLPREQNEVSVGHNIETSNKKWNISALDDGKTAVIALPKLGNTNPNEWLEFAKDIDNKLFDENGKEKFESVIIDIRDNPGGAAVPFEILAKKLYGNEVAPFEKSAYRDTKEADYIRCVNGEISKDKYEDRLKNHDYSGKYVEICNYSAHDQEYPAFAKGGYKKPITVLTNRQTASAGESLCQFLKHHPGVAYVGENTAGCYAEVSGKPIMSKFDKGIKIGSSHCFFENNESFERKGFPVDRNTNGQDAFEYTKRNLAMINVRAKLKLKDYQPSEIPKKDFNKLANNDIAFVRGINDGMDIGQVKNLYSAIYPDKKDNFNKVTNYALHGEFTENFVKDSDKSKLSIKDSIHRRV